MEKSKPKSICDCPSCVAENFRFSEYVKSIVSADKFRVDVARVLDETGITGHNDDPAKAAMYLGLMDMCRAAVSLLTQIERQRQSTKMYNFVHSKRGEEDRSVDENLLLMKATELENFIGMVLMLPMLLVHSGAVVPEDVDAIDKSASAAYKKFHNVSSSGCFYKETPLNEDGQPTKH